MTESLGGQNLVDDSSVVLYSNTEYMLKLRLRAVVRSPRREPWEKTPAPLSPASWK